jgi:hypothetical protein
VSRGRGQRRQEAEPAERGVARQAGRGHGRHAGQRLQRCVAGDRERAELAGLDVLQHDLRGGEHELDLAPEEIRHRLPRALVRHVQHVDAGERLEQLAGEVRGGAGPDEPKRIFPGLALA